MPPLLLCCDPDILFPQTDPTEALQLLPGHNTGIDQENVRLGRTPREP